MKGLVLGNALFVALFFGAPLAAQITPIGEVFHPDQRVTISNLAVVTATDPSRAAVAKAALEIVLSGSMVRCDPASHLSAVVDANGGAPLRMLAGKISGIPCATNGQARHVTATFTPNGAIQAENLIAPVLEGKPLLFEWKNTLYVLYGVVYDEHLRDDGSKMNVIRRLLLIDPRYSDKRRLVEFERGKDDFSQFEGFASVAATK